MNAGRRTDGLLSSQQTFALLGLMKQYPHGRAVDHFLRDLAASYPAVWSKGRNTVALLSEMRVVKEKDGLIWIADITMGRDEWRKALGELIAKTLIDRLIAAGTSRCLQTKGTGDLWLDSMLLPGAAEGFPLWIVEFDVARREHIESRFWRIGGEYKSLFLAGARDANLKLLRRSLSAAKLEERLADDAIHGRQAEEWALAFERNRLASHPLIEQVRRVSDENVVAGYDIASFSSPTALHHDLFIEVKSYVGTKRFYWSRNEIAAAERLGESYSLYLVDRSLMQAPDYEPQIIPGPYSALFQSPGSGWSISPTTFEFMETPATEPTMPRKFDV